MRVHVDFTTSEVSPCVRMAGLSILERTCATLRRAGLEVVAHVGEHRCRRVPRGVELSSEPAPEGALDGMVLLDFRKVGRSVASTGYGDALVMEIRTWDDVERAERWLWESLRKPIENDGVVAYYVVRPLSRLITRALINTPVTPNQVTVLAGLMGLAAAALVAVSLPLGALLLWFSNVLDCVDGEIARLKLQGSRLGEWLDTVGDDLVSAFYPLGLAVATGGPHLMTVAWLGALLYMGSALVVYAHLARRPVVDTAQFPWFFLGEQGAASKEKGIGHYLAYLVRRDVVITLHLLFGLAGLALPSFLLQTALNYGYAVLIAIDTVVKMTGRSRP